MAEFWNESMTGASWDELVRMAKKHEFVLIGGWAAYLWTRAQKSKDIDIVVDFGALREMMRDYPVSKNERLSKYEAKTEKFDIDIYLPHYSKLAVPCEEILREFAVVEGIRIAKPEMLLILKQGAEVERRGTAKGRKDAIDIANILHAGADLKEYAALARKHGHDDYPRQLATALEQLGDAEIPYLGIGFVEFKKWKKMALAEIKAL